MSNSEAEALSNVTGRLQKTPSARMSRFVDRHMHILFLAPAMIVLLFMMLYPIGFMLYYSLHDWFVTSLAPQYFVGLENYGKLWEDTRFKNSILHSVYFVVLAISSQLVLGLGIALLFNREFYGRGAARTLLLLPMMSTPAALALVWLMMMDPTLGLLNYLLSLAGLGPQLWLADPRTVIPSLVLIDTWQWTPLVILIVMAGLASLPTEPYEAAMIDGASRLQVFTYITLPLLRPTLMVALMFRMIDSWKVFDTIYVTTAGGPRWASETLNLYAFNVNLKYMHMGYGSAVLVVLGLIVFGFSFLFSRWRRSSYWS